MFREKVQWIEEMLAPEMEGKCYEHIWMTQVVEIYSVCVDYYMVEKGEVYMINDGTKQASGDSLEDTKNQCACIGDYDCNKIYKRQLQYFSKEEIKSRLFQTTNTI